MVSSNEARHTRCQASWRRTTRSSRGCFDIDVPQEVRELFKYIVEAGDGLNTTDPGLTHRAPRQSSDGASAIGGAGQVRVVVHDDDAVGGGVDVGFDIAEPFRLGGPE